MKFSYLKVNIFITAIDFQLQELNNRFYDQQLSFLFYGQDYILKILIANSILMMYVIWQNKIYPRDFIEHIKILFKISIATLPF